jgi:hypothetical protein
VHKDAPVLRQMQCAACNSIEQAQCSPAAWMARDTYMRPLTFQAKGLRLGSPWSWRKHCIKEIVCRQIYCSASTFHVQTTPGMSSLETPVCINPTPWHGGLPAAALAIVKGGARHIQQQSCSTTEQRSHLRYVVQAAGEHEVGRQRAQCVAGHAVVPVQGGVAHKGEDGVHDPGGQEAEVANEEVEGVQHLQKAGSTLD